MSKCSDSALSVFHMNIRKFSKHRGEFYAYLKSLVHEFDIIVRSEIGGNASHYLSSILNNYDYVYELPQGNNYGGIAIYSKRGLHTSERNNLRLQKTCNCSKCNFESVWIDVTKRNQTCTIGGVYRHPGGSAYHFNTALELSLSKTNNMNPCIFTGDTNINLLDIDGAITTDYISSIMSHGFVPYVTRPTKITEFTAILIDHMFVKLHRGMITAPITAGILFNDITDHLHIFLLMSTQKKNI